MTHTWKIVRLYTLDQPRELTVTSVDWELALEDGLDQVRTWGTVVLPNPQLSEFVDYQDLSPDQVIEWVKANMGQGQGRNARTYSAVLKDLEDQMQALKHPSLPTPSPWPNE